MFQALSWLIAKFYDVTHSFAFAIILLTVTVRLVLSPLTAKQMRSTQRMQEVQPELKRIQNEFKDDRPRQQEELMKFYRENKVNPAAGCLPLFVQLPIFFVLNFVIRGLTNRSRLAGINIAASRPKYIGTGTKMFHDIVESGGRMVSWGTDLGRSAAQATGGLGTRLPYFILLVLVGLTGYLQQVQANRRQTGEVTGQAAQMQKMMKFFPPIFAVTSYNFPAGMVLYWVASNVWTMAQQAVLFRLVPVSPVVSGGAASAAAAVSSASGTGSAKGGTVKGNGPVGSDGDKPARPTKAIDRVSAAAVGAGSSGAAGKSGAKPRPGSFRAAAADARAAAAEAAAAKSARRPGGGATPPPSSARKTQQRPNQKKKGT